MLTWQQELRELLDSEPRAAERIIRGIDAGRMDVTMYGYWRERDGCGCAYGHALQDGFRAMGAVGRVKIRAAADPDYCGGLSPLEEMARPENQPELRAECVAWLAEHGTASEPAPAPQPMMAEVTG